MSLSSLRRLALLSLLATGCGDDDGAPTTDGAGGDTGTGAVDAATDATADATPATAWIGDSCGGDAECAGGVCFADDEGFPGGYCSNESCDVAVPDSCLAFGGDGTCLDIGGTGTCLDRCVEATDCRTGYACVAVGMGRRVCYPIPVCGNGIVEFGEECEPPGSTNCDAACVGTGTAPVGAACTGPEDCLGNGCASEADGFPLGYCTQVGCDVTMAATSCAPYGGDGVCIDVGEATPFTVCLDACDPNAAVSECRAGYYCQPGGPAGGVCFPAPECGDSVIEFPEECDPPDGAACDASCIGTGTDPIGADCASAADCAGNACIDEMGAWPMGYCAHGGCDLGADPEAACAAYGGDGICLDVSEDGDPFGVCLDQCASNADCRTGYFCQFAGGGVHICGPRPPCGDSTVEYPEECDPPNGTTCLAGCVGAGTQPVGATCTSAADCAGDGCFSMADGFTGGYCTDIDCDLTADPVTACAAAGGDGYCFDLGEGVGFCLDQCGSCRPGYSCMSVGGGVRICVP
jgi:hypothetical protein